MNDIPAALRGERILWQGVDDTTPDGCTLITAYILGIVTTYVLRDGQIIGRIEAHGGQNGYAGSALKGGYHLGSGDSTTLGKKIAEHRWIEES